MSRFTGSSSGTCLLVAFGLFGMGMGMVNSQISVAAVAGMPPGQAGLASGIASSARLLGQALGVAVAGSLLTAKAHGPLQATFGPASHPAWYILFWCASAVVACGLATRHSPPRHGAAARSPSGGTRPSQAYPPLQPQATLHPLASWTPPRPPEPVWVPRFLMNMEPFLMNVKSPDDPEPGPVFPGNPPGWLPPDRAGAGYRDPCWAAARRRALAWVLSCANVGIPVE
jgi:MFS family permease